MKGKIIKAHRGIYYVDIGDHIILCKARGLFREMELKPVVGDDVDIRISEEDGSGYIEKIYSRKNTLLRPVVSNVDQALIVMSLKNPAINLFLLDCFLLMCEKSRVDVLICINKSDLILQEKKKTLLGYYAAFGYSIIFTSTVTGENSEILLDYLKGKTTVFSGPSGVGKSSLLNLLTKGKWQSKVGNISEKTKRGKHTTRHVELYKENANTFFLDTPGFSSLDLRFFESPYEIKELYPEFIQREKFCRFNDCNHLREPGCKIKEDVARGLISEERYRNYELIFQEVQSNQRY